MLRFLFDEPAREADGSLAIAFGQMDQFIRLAQKSLAGDSSHSDKMTMNKLEVWALGLRSSLDELEQSCYAASRYGALIETCIVQKMSNEERTNYNRYIYFDKNAFIRVFSLLDKIGTFLNTLLDMRTEKIKAHYSYFTVLRAMRERRVHADFTSKLNAIKEKYKEPMSRLRNRRNTEIHYMNSEMQDDLIQRQRMYGTETRLENITEQSKDLAQGYAMVLESLCLTFQYACMLARSKQV